MIAGFIGGIVVGVVGAILWIVPMAERIKRRELHHLRDQRIDYHEGLWDAYLHCWEFIKDQRFKTMALTMAATEVHKSMEDVHKWKSRFMNAERIVEGKQVLATQEMLNEKIEKGNAAIKYLVERAMDLAIQDIQMGRGE